MEGTAVSGRKNWYFLVVDNDVDDRFLISMVLQRFGYNICTASTASDAVEFMHVAPPAAIIADAGIGAGLVSSLKKDLRFSDTQVIFLAKARDLDLELKARRGEIAACLAKPLDVELFYQTIQAVIEKTPRKNIRIGTSLEATIGIVADGIKGCVTVLSEFGMFVRTKEPQDVNERVPIRVELKGRTMELEAVVLYSYSLEASPFKEPGMGMKFVKISPEDQALIKSYILEAVRGGIVEKERA